MLFVETFIYNIFLHVCYFHAYTDGFCACLIKGVAICGIGDNDLVQLKTW